MASRMAENYARQVDAGTRKIKDVPTLWRKEVQDLLRKQKASASG